MGFVARLGVAGYCGSIFYLDGEGGVEAYEAILGEFAGSLNGFKKVRCGVVDLEFGEEFKGRLGEGDSFVVYGVG
jgi:hypothetical protein